MPTAKVGRSRWVFLTVVLCLAVGLGRAEKEKSPPVRKIDQFTLNDTAGKPWSLKDCQAKKAVVVVFLGTECPVNNAYLPRLAELHETYDPQGVQFIAINANQQDTPDRVVAHAKQHSIPFPVLKDEGNKVADRFLAERTPEAFILDAGRVICYQGRIDDQFGIGFKRPAPTRRDLAEALDALLAGKAVAQSRTDAPGCRIARAVKQKTEAKVTYAKHVAPLLQKHCQECHQPGQIGPMPLLTYDDASSWSETIKDVVKEKRMPPWYADPRHGHFENDRSLPSAERDLLFAWIEQGCAKGDDRDLPPAPKLTEGWRIGKPDVVLTMPYETKVAAKAPRGIRYQYIFVPTNFEEDKWVQAVEAKAGNKAVVHHILVYARKAGDFSVDAADGIGDRLLVAYAPGDLPATFPQGKAKNIPKGAVLVFQMHYTPNGTEQTDRSSVGLIFAKEPSQHEVQTRAVAQTRFTIPPGESNHKVVSTSTFKKDAVLLSLFPHMHLRGKSFEFQVIFPDGRKETLLSVPRYNFDWQNNYRLAKPLDLPAGTKIECTAFFDNSTDNLNNPDPTKSVRWGEQTWDEMMIGFMDYYYKERAD